MSGHHKSSSVIQRGQRQIIEEKVDTVDVDDISIKNMSNDTGGNRIAHRSSIGDSRDLDPVDHLRGLQYAVGMEDAIEGDNPDVYAQLLLLAHEVVDSILHAADRRPKLPDNVDYTHALLSVANVIDNSCRCTIAISYAEPTLRYRSVTASTVTIAKPAGAKRSVDPSDCRDAARIAS